MVSRQEHLSNRKNSVRRLQPQKGAIVYDSSLQGSHAVHLGIVLSQAEAVIAASVPASSNVVPMSQYYSADE